MAKRATRTTSIIRFQSDDTVEKLERATGQGSKKAVVIVLRWVLVIACAGLIFSGEAYQINRLYSQLIILSLLLSNLVLAALPQRVFQSRFFDQTLLIIDVALITSCIWFTGGSGGDLYLLYFLSLMIAAMGETLYAVVFSALLVSLVYLLINLGRGGLPAIANSEFLIRVPFFYVVALFVGYFAQLLRRERSKRVEYKVKLDVNEQVRDISNRLVRSMDCDEILTMLADALCEFCDAGYCAIVSLDSEEILVESGEWDRYTHAKKTLTIINSLRVQLRNYVEESVPQITSSTGLRTVHDEQTQLCFTNDQFTFLPLEGTTKSDLYVCMIGRFRSEVMGYASLIICTAWVAVERALQYLTLEQEVERSQMLAEKLTDALNFRAAFLEKVSGDVKTPLYTIIGLAELLIKGGYGPLNEEQRGVLERMLEGAKGMRKLVQTFLEQAMLDSGEYELELSSEETNDMVRSLAESCRPWFERLDVELKIDCDQLVPQVTTDWGLVKQIIKNFVSNAFRHTDFGEVVVSCRYDELVERVEISVRDTGVGIPKDRLEQLFHPFRPIQQGGDAGSSGLGLAVNKLQAASLGGEIEVRSTLGEGSTFTLVLPLAHPSTNVAEDVLGHPA